MTFNESNTVEAFIRDRLQELGWEFIDHATLPRQPQEVLVEPHLRDALIRLNPTIAERPERVDEVLYRLRAAIMTVRDTGLVKANEEFAAWLLGDRSMPFGENGEHVTIRLLDFEDLKQNRFVVTQQFTFRAGKTEKRADLVLLVNGMPLVVIEAKTPVRSSQSWLDGALQVHDDYEKNVPELFVPNLLSVATEGKEYRYGAIAMPVELWGPWRLEGEDVPHSMEQVEKAMRSMLRPSMVLDMLASFTAYATHKGKQRIKIIARYQQVEGVNRIVERVVAGSPRKGLIWHFQGSGKSLLMLFAARKLRLHPALKNPTVLVVVDRIDLDSQISGTFYAADMPNMVRSESRHELKDLLEKDVRKVVVTTIHKFGETYGVLNTRDNIIVMVDEAHRTQEGDLGRRMREALPNAFLFGLTGTPINRADKNTFYAFGAEEDANGYMSRYGLEESIRDGATRPLHFEPRLVELHIDQAAIEDAYKELTEGLTDEDRDKLGKAAAKMAVLVKAPERVRAICADIAAHYQEKVAPNGFGAQVVTFDRESCLLYKQELDRHLPPEVSDIVMSVNSGEDQYNPYRRDRTAEEALLDRFRDPKDPLKILIVTAKLLTGFDAPILQTMYLDKPLRDHTLLQAICRTNRPYGETKSHGLIVDYLGIFDDVALALQFDEKGVQKAVSNITELVAALPGALQKCLAYFAGVDRTLTGYEGLIAAQDCLPTDKQRDAFAADFSVLARIWEAISPDPVLGEYEKDYRWLAQVYESLKPSTGTGRLLWHRLGAKTIELIHENVHVDAVRDDLDTLVLDVDLLEAVLGDPDPKKKAKEITIKLTARLRKHAGNPKYKALAERLEDLKNRHEHGLLVSIDFLKALLDLAKDVVKLEREMPIEEEIDRGKAALTELFEEAKNGETPVMVKRIVDDIDEIVRQVRFDGWQNTHAGEREVKIALRKTLFKYKLHQDTELFDRAYGYIREYY
ncbi:MAG: HsdR family type I site-specific deoxyribonuclease [Candidatus Thiodiazotropha endolucinida]|nr:HsdR family type I site-specific deoxyribonuclease [Candidatus Thiodiazotropha taylori]MCG8094932.1 HsdR family type I site-specific deoxyribonuclease [Candidatus Thiodiazotropha endolucinida]MCG8045970.1 HsdR family type I site-specific deoxyribonuclease [Candidatus Thiodiazotropha taylori]MCG8052879.1 HsdR family type I site-specific deoxyribonuclease [Candidatus Thiodiazotropha taylori]MCW4314699.1 HsdR family type I site-specific deoxyribonuclease [Candidatus Thiodiazotropha taylori]